MIAKVPDNAVCFRIQLFLDFAAGLKRIPHPALNLKVKAQVIRSLKCCFRRTPGMKAHMIQTIGLAHLKNLRPGINVRRRITRHRKIAAKMSAAKVNGSAIENKLVAVHMEIPQAKYAGRLLVKVELICAAAHLSSYLKKCGFKFIPK